MVFDVTCRNAKTGDKEVLQIEAPSKDAIWPKLKEKGINPISINEAKKKSSKSNKSRGGSSNNFKTLLLVLVAMLGLCGALVYFCQKEEPKNAPVKEKKTPKTVRTVKPALPKEQPQAPVEEVSKVDKEKAERIAKLRAMTPEERMQYLFEEAAKKPIDLTPSTNRLFKTGTEQVMSWIFTTELGAMPPPLPRIPIRDEAHMAEILMAKNPIFEGDSEKAKEAKQMVELAKKELIKYIKEGGTVDSFLEYYRGELMQAHNEWKECQKSVLQVVRDEPDLAADYIAEINNRLSQKSIRPVKLPPKLKEQLGIED